MHNVMIYIEILLILLSRLPILKPIIEQQFERTASRCGYILQGEGLSAATTTTQGVVYAGRIRVAAQTGVCHRAGISAKFWHSNLRA